MTSEHRVSPPPEALAGAGFVAGLRPSHLALVAGYFRVERYRAGEWLFHKGDTGLDLYVIIEGKVAIREPGAAPDQHVATMGPGEVLGEIAFIDSSERSMDGVCLTDTEVAVLSQENFYRLVDEYPIIGALIYRNLAIELCARLRQTNEMLARAEGWVL